jgi:hypothetical protein
MRSWQVVDAIEIQHCRATAASAAAWIPGELLPAFECPQVTNRSKGRYWAHTEASLSAAPADVSHAKKNANYSGAMAAAAGDQKPACSVDPADPPAECPWMDTKILTPPLPLCEPRL